MHHWDSVFLRFVSFLSESPYVWIPFAFLFGSMVGSLLNVCILRMPRRKSLWWPSSRCGACFQAIPGQLNLPLLSYLRLRGRCRVCGARYSPRYFWIELLTACLFAALFWLEVAADARGVGQFTSAWRHHDYDSRLVLIWAYHAVLASCLIAAVFIDLACGAIPHSLLLLGMVVGVAGGTLGAWPWPAHEKTLAIGLQTLPLWTNPPPWFGPGSLQLGLATALGGVLAGWLVHWLICRLAPQTMPTIGGDWLLMMIGAYSGWQVLGLTALIAALLASSWSLLARGRPLRFSPFLALATLVGLLSFGRLWIAFAVR